MELKQLIDKAEDIAKKESKRESKTIKIKRFEKLGIENPFVVIEKPTLTTIISSRERAGNNLYALSESMKYPDISNKELQKAFKVNNKQALLKKMFTEDEIDEMNDILISLASTRTKTEIIDDIKN